MKNRKKFVNNLQAGLDLCVSSTSGLLDNLLHAKHTLNCRDDVFMSVVSLKDALGCADNLHDMLHEMVEAIYNTLPKKKDPPDGLKLNFKGLQAFDKEYFDYLDDEYCKKQKQTKDCCLRHLTTWFFDNDDRELERIQKAFGKKIAENVIEYRKARKHDT